jgi:Tol biopolymer transport system component
MSKIFISYRRQDARPVATLIYEPLARHFEARFGAGAVFMDVHGIPLGVNFRAYLNEQVGKAELLIALIADRWLTSADEHGARRIDSPNDFVRIEIEAALKRGVPVVPVYVDDAKFLREADLPDSLKDLAWMNGFQLSTDPRYFSANLARFIADLEPHFTGKIRSAQPKLETNVQATPPAIQEGQRKARFEFGYENPTTRLVRTYHGHDEAVRSVAIGQSGKFALSASGEQRIFNRTDRSLRLWELTTGANRLIMQDAEIIWAVALSPDNRLALCASGDCSLKLFDIESGKEINTFKGHTNWALAAAFSPDGSSIVSGGAEHTVRLWDASTGRETKTFSGHNSWVRSVIFSPDGRNILSGSDDETLKLWDARTGNEISTFRGHGSYVRAVAFSPDGRKILSGGDDSKLKLWDASTGEQIKELAGHTAKVRAVAFSPDGRFAISGSSDVKLWDVATEKVITTFTGHTDWVNSVAFSQDGRCALSGSDDKTLKLWDASEWTQAL